LTGLKEKHITPRHEFEKMELIVRLTRLLHRNRIN